MICRVLCMYPAGSVGTRASVLELVAKPAERYDQPMDRQNLPTIRALVLGDTIAYALITIIGFSSHGLLEASAILRILATFLPFYGSWVLFAFWGGVSRPAKDHSRRWLLRSGICAVLSAPFAATLRGFWLGSPILPTFVLVMAGVSAFGIMMWRLLFQQVIHPRLMG